MAAREVTAPSAAGRTGLPPEFRGTSLPRLSGPRERAWKAPRYLLAGTIYLWLPNGKVWIIRGPQTRDSLPSYLPSVSLSSADTFDLSHYNCARFYVTSEELSPRLRTTSTFPSRRPSPDRSGDVHTVSLPRGPRSDKSPALCHPGKLSPHVFIVFWKRRTSYCKMQMKRL